MIPLAPMRSRFAIPTRLLAGLTLAALIQGAPAWAGPFITSVDVNVVPIGFWGDETDPGAVNVTTEVNMNHGGYQWYLHSIGLINPVNPQGMQLYPQPHRYGDLVDELFDTVGGRGAQTDVYWVWPGDPVGVFTGGSVVVTGMRYQEFDDDGHGSDPIYLTDTVGFGFTIPDPNATPDPNVVPEPAAVTLAAVAAAVGGVFAAARRRRRAG